MFYNFTTPEIIASAIISYPVAFGYVGVIEESTHGRLYFQTVEIALVMLL